MICLVLPQKMPLAQGEIVYFTFVSVCNGEGYCNASKKTMPRLNSLVYPMWALVHKIYSSCLKQENDKTVGGMATQSTALCVTLGHVVISFLALLGF